LKAWRNFNQIVTLENALKKDGRNLLPSDLTIIENGSIVFDDSSILWIGKDSNFPASYNDVPSKKMDGYILLPEIVDCHTHLIFGGDRSTEYTMRLNGATYEEIANSGGGILHTMIKTNALSFDQLFEISKKRIETISSYGVGSLEIKSGYGLNYAKEKELSLVIAKLKKHFAPNIQIKNTYLAAHAIPKDFNSSHEYMEKVVLPLLSELAPLKIIDAVDIFHEKGYFNRQDSEALFKLANSLDIATKSHADEFYDNDGAALAASYSALSTDHLMMTSQSGIETLSKSSTVAVMLPGTSFFLGKELANARLFLDQGCKVAIASDFNPGSCHWDNVVQIAAMSAPKYKMNLAEMWSAITLNAAHALNLKNQGALRIGLTPRFSIFKIDHLDLISYEWGKNFNSSLKDF
jgi:imidazolonepropionase